MKISIITLLLVVLLSTTGNTRNRYREKRDSRPAMSRTHSSINDSLDIVSKANRIHDRSMRNAMDMIERSQWIHDDARRNRAIHRRERNRYRR